MDDNSVYSFEVLDVNCDGFGFINKTLGGYLVIQWNLYKADTP